MLNKIGSILQSRKAPPKEVEQAYNSVYDNADHCVSCGRVIPEGSQVCIICGLEKPKKQTQYDRIRNRSVDEMAEFLCDNFDCDVCPAFDRNYCPNGNLKICSMAMKKYLESEAEEK